ncbi:hypothetical protein Pcinc_003508 [Petrolisthes cinctipes]|uniref:Uncharacterized protein n=1 Tax=Petrolisthes cinctipes TaxID=88211 RepID=A0AAE1L2H6_PETCI|nr:hypothetical protein Pcinc_003508 [Petrolisthes cinctipes]
MVTAAIGTRNWLKFDHLESQVPVKQIQDRQTEEQRLEDTEGQRLEDTDRQRDRDLKKQGQRLEDTDRQRDIDLKIQTDRGTET